MRQIVHFLIFCCISFALHVTAEENLSARRAMAQFENACTRGKSYRGHNYFGILEIMASLTIQNEFDCRYLAEKAWKQVSLDLKGYEHVNIANIVESFDGFVNITTLILTDTSVRTLKGLGQAFPNLTTLNASADCYPEPRSVIYKSNLTDIDGVGDIPLLEKIDLSCQTKVADFGPLAKAKKLRTINLQGTRIKTLDFVRCCTLEHLDIFYTPIKSLLPLSRLGKLKTLKVGKEELLESLTIPVGYLNNTRPYNPSH